LVNIKINYTGKAKFLGNASLLLAFLVVYVTNQPNINLITKPATSQSGA